MAERNECVVAFQGRVLEPGNQLNGLLGSLDTPLEIVNESLELPFGWRPVETAHPGVDRVDFSSSHRGDDVVSNLLEPQAQLDLIRIVLRHVDGRFVAQEVGSVEQEHMEAVALDPLTAVDESAESIDPRGHLDPEGILHRVDRRGLVADGAYATDARRDVGSLGEVPFTHERFEEPRRLEDSKLELGDAVLVQLDVERALAFHPGQIVDVNRALAHRMAPSSRSLASFHSGAYPL